MNESIQANEPFLIRGHHLSMFQEMSSFVEKVAQRKGLSSEDVVITADASVRRLVRKLRNAQRLRKLGISLGNNPGTVNIGFTDLAEYADDTIGNTEETRERFASNTKQFIETFFSLSSDAPVLITNKPDGMCAGCALGKHCHDGGYKLYDWTAIQEFLSVVTSDSELNSLFVKNAPKEGFMDVTVSTSAGSLRRAFRKIAQTN